MEEKRRRNTPVIQFSCNPCFYVTVRREKKSVPGSRNQFSNVSFTASLTKSNLLIPVDKFGDNASDCSFSYEKNLCNSDSTNPSSSNQKFEIMRSFQVPNPKCCNEDFIEAKGNGWKKCRRCKL